MALYKLTSPSEDYRWALKDNKMIFSHIVWLSKEEDKSLYHLIDNNGDEVKVDIESCVSQD